MSPLLLQIVIVVAFGAFCFGCGYLAAFILTRNHWRDEMIKRGVARCTWQSGKWELGGAAERRKEIELSGQWLPKSIVSRPGFSFAFLQSPVVAHTGKD